MSSMDFSVCMSVYKNDKAEYFVDAVHSIYFNQTVRPTEVIIVVDGSVPDEIERVLIQLQNEIDVLRLIRFDKNQGHAGARQAGLNATTNNIVAIMDADDISLPDRLEKQLKLLEMHPEISVVGGQITEFVNGVDNIVGKRIVPCGDENIKLYLKSRCPMNLVTVMYRKNDVLSAGGFLDWYCEEDYYLWIRMAEAGCKLANLPDTLVNVRVGKDMYARRGGWKYFKSEAKLQRYMLNHKIISLPRYVYNVLGRFVVQVAMPDWLRGVVFQKLFRK